MSVGKITRLAALGWVICGVLAFGGINAYSRAAWPSLNGSERAARLMCGQSVALSLFGPIALVMNGLLSGFWYDGLSYDCSPVRSFL